MKLSFVLLLISLCSFGQTKVETLRLLVSFDLGTTWRSTLMNVFDFKDPYADEPGIPVNYEKHIQGFAFSPGINFYSKEHRVGVGYMPTIRYDYIYGHRSQPKGEIFDLLTEHHLFVFRNYKLRAKDEKSVYAGLGVALMNPGKRYWIEKKLTDSTNRFIKTDFWYDIQYVAVDARLGIPLGKKYWIETTATLIPQTFPTNNRRSYLTYSVRFFYRFEGKKL